MDKMSSDWKIIVFDMDGVLIDAKSSWAWIHDRFGVDNEDSLKAYERGDIDDGEFIRRDIELWKSAEPNISRQDIIDILKTAPVMKGFHKVIPSLKENYNTAIISGGLKPLAEHVGGEYFDRIFANDIKDHEGRLSSRGIVDVPLKNKGDILEKLLSEEGIKKERCVAIGNSHIDAPMLERAGLGIAFNPDDEKVKRSADWVIEEKDLSALFDVLDM